MRIANYAKHLLAAAQHHTQNNFRSLHKYPLFVPFQPYKLHRLDSGPATEATITKDEALKLYTQMQTIRRLETSAGNLYKDKIVRGFCHLYSGQEACAVGEWTTIYTHTLNIFRRVVVADLIGGVYTVHHEAPTIGVELFFNFVELARCGWKSKWHIRNTWTRQPTERQPQHIWCTLLENTWEINILCSDVMGLPRGGYPITLRQPFWMCAFVARRRNIHALCALCAHDAIFRQLPLE